MAKRRVKIAKSGQSVIIEYDFDERYLYNGLLNVKIFDKPSEEWSTIHNFHLHKIMDGALTIDN